MKPCRSFSLVLLAIACLSSAAARKTGRAGAGRAATAPARRAACRRTGAARENVAWKVAVPGKGHASPIVWGDRIFVASCLEDARASPAGLRSRPADGLLWQQVGARTRRWKTSTSSTASPPARRPPTASWSTSRFSTATEMVVAAYDFDGQRAMARSARRVLQQARLLQLPGAVRGQGDRQRRPRRRRLPGGPGPRHRQNRVESRPREQDPQLRRRPSFARSTAGRR